MPYPKLFEDRVPLHVELERRDRDAFHSVCALNGTTVSDAIRGLVREVLDRHRGELERFTQEDHDG